MAKKKQTANEIDAPQVSKAQGIIIGIFLTILSILFLAPIFIVLITSFKSKLYISAEPFQLPNAETLVGLSNYTEGAVKIGFFQSFGWSLFITVLSVGVIVLFTAMTAWVITRIKSKFTSMLYYFFVFAMIVPFQMVMFTMTFVANRLHLDNPVGIIIIYLGFGSGLSVFMFSGFVKAIPIAMEEAAMIDGCNPLQTFFNIVFPMLKPTAITVAILNAMWVWNDYLLPYLILGTEHKTIPIAIQYLRWLWFRRYGCHDGDVGTCNYSDYYFPSHLSEIYIIGVVAGAVKG